MLILPQEHPQGFPRIASRPSQTTKGTIAKAAIGSAHDTLQIALAASPNNAMTERYAQVPDCTASALNAALHVTADSLRFSFARTGMTMAAAIRIAMPRRLGAGWRCPARVTEEIATT